jgi:hypothetical protein
MAPSDTMIHTAENDTDAEPHGRAIFLSASNAASPDQSAF